MRFNCLCLCLLALILGAGAAGAQGFSLLQSIDMTGGAFSEDFVNSLFGIGGMGTESSGPWFGPEFENTSSAYSFFSEFYINTSVPVISGFTPVKIDVTHKMPSRIYFGSGREVTYTQYQSAIATARGNELWIQKGLDWSQYAIVPAGTGMQFIAFAPAGGQADYYEIVQTDALNITSKRVNFYSGYNSLNFMADKVGRHILLFVLNNQPSNSIIVDVISQAPPAQQAPPPARCRPPLICHHPPICRLPTISPIARLQSDHYERPRPDHHQRIDLLPDIWHILSATDRSRGWRHSSYHSVPGNEGLSGLSG